jgi:uncharacterized phage protein (TIGR02218 family)
MKTPTGSLTSAYLTSNSQFIVVDLYTLTVINTAWASGLSVSYTKYYYSGSDYDVVYGGHTFTGSDAIFARDGLKQTIGLEVATMDITVNATASMLVLGIPFMQAITQGVLDGAMIKVERAFLNADHSVIGTVNWFTGHVAKASPSRNGASITINSLTDLLNVKVPRNVYQAACQNSLYDGACGLSRSSYAASGTVSGVSGWTITITGTAAMSVAGYWNQGGLVFTSGALNGEARTIKSFTGGIITLLSPFQLSPAIGDTFMVYAGCDKQLATCQNKFNNGMAFKGQPFVPTPETVI